LRVRDGVGATAVAAPCDPRDQALPRLRSFARWGLVEPVPMIALAPEIVARRLATMRTLLDHLATLEVSTPEDLEDLGVRLQVERILSQLVNLAADINAHVAVAVLNRPPEDYREGFDRMVDADFLHRETAKRLKPSVGLRNVLT